MTSSSAKVIMTRSDRTWSIWCGFRLATFCTWLEVSTSILKEVIAKNVFLTFFMTLTLTFDLDSWKVIGFRLGGCCITGPSLVNIELMVSEKNVLQTNKKTRKQVPRRGSGCRNLWRHVDITVIIMKCQNSKIENEAILWRHFDVLTSDWRIRYHNR